MQLPLFFIEESSAANEELLLNEDTSKHVIQSLRMAMGEELLVTDGKGHLLRCSIIDDHKKKCRVKVLERTFKEKEKSKMAIAISLLKNAGRFEWFLEKATELGIAEIIPLICARTEKQHFRLERMKSILASAMVQSQQSWLPILREPVKLEEIIEKADYAQKFIAHCLDDAKVSLVDAVNHAAPSQLILIGPEGDFTKEEIALAFKSHFVPVALGNTRLRTETAGMVAATILALE
jgi:16S rRNA (uracil1498-N3)-methyltransferase